MTVDVPMPTPRGAAAAAAQALIDVEAEPAGSSGSLNGGGQQQQQQLGTSPGAGGSITPIYGQQAAIADTAAGQQSSGDVLIDVGDVAGSESKAPAESNGA
jgi:hypothetical protein